ncbi:hypothetical protein NW759_010497 [Fusarium solani]|nr:hypothetical protein NW759_010497 [Fusarium solani]
MPADQASIEHPKLRIPEEGPVALGKIVKKMEQRPGPNSSSISLQPLNGRQARRRMTGSMSGTSDRSSRVKDYGRSFWEDPTSKSPVRYAQSLSVFGTCAPGTLPPGAEVKSLADCLVDAMVPHYNDRTKDWIPPSDLMRLCSPQAVSAVLKRMIDASQVEVYTNYVCGMTPDDFKNGYSAYLVFATLVLIRRLDMLDKFFRAKICDKHFPFAWRDKSMLQLHSRQSRGKRRRRFPSTEKEFMSTFYSAQWHFNVPVISMTGNRQATEYKLHPNTIMPWTSFEPVEKLGGFSAVNKVEIHPDHRRFSGHDTFALKVLHSTYEMRESKQEIRGLRKITPRPHVVEILSIFQRGSEISFLLPWANGGSLDDLMKLHPSKLFASTADTSTMLIRWIAEQCAGITTGLGGIRDALCSKVDEHMSINPGNVLHFTNEKSGLGLGELKVSELFPMKNDMLISTYSAPEWTLRSQRGSTVVPEWTSTYQRPGKGKLSSSCAAPSKATEDPELSRRTDIWALGSLFLMLLTWAIQGPGGLRKFQCARLNEQDHRRHWFMDTFFRCAARDSSHSPCEDFMVKQAVRLCVKLNKRAVSGPEGQSNYLTEFLDFILRRMLVVDRGQRAGTDMVYEFLSKKAQEYNKAGYHVTLPTLDGSLDLDEPGCTCDHDMCEFHCQYQDPARRVSA